MAIGEAISSQVGAGANGEETSQVIDVAAPPQGRAKGWLRMEMESGTDMETIHSPTSQPSSR